ncbi:hypothetical protein BDP55DRAFT_635607 [Colletotrichum godetiae]|uniref:Uncharacterized protein n=1 Tax=Colletotrichum godetiae TaxID=1209918 RepID=A0AAJ0AD57_9PEZI|nr:uncharacterized protein BDP55DRAFT_635607 [Colletotrichum godetiae]KAK1671748.1 hypothetical protein BDP55DRAFT_635607 [Colletotrichum godetiae]
MESKEEAGLCSSKDVLSKMSPEARKNTYNKAIVVSTPVFVSQDSQNGPIEFFVPGKPTQWPRLPLVKFLEYNEQETDAVFYGSNHFNLVDTTTRRKTSILEAFLVSPTSTHARLLSHLSLSFPTLEAVEGRSEMLGLTQNGTRTLKLLQDYCVNLKTLELYLFKFNAFGLVGEAPGDSQSRREALLQVNAQLKAVPSLKRLLVRCYHDRTTPEVIQLMQGLGWMVLVGDKGLS